MQRLVDEGMIEIRERSGKRASLYLAMKGSPRPTVGATTVG